MSENVWKLKTSDLPLLVELSADNGDIDYLEMKLSKSRQRVISVLISIEFLSQFVVSL